MWIDETNAGKFAVMIANVLKQHLGVAAAGGGNGSTGGGSDRRGDNEQLPSRYMTTRQAAAYLGVTKQALFHLKARGAFHRHGCVIQHGRSIRWDRLALDKWADSYRI